MKRRKFIRNNGLVLAGTPLLLSADMPGLSNTNMSDRIQFTRDGLDLNPIEYSELLVKITGVEDVVDYYSRGGVVEKMEKKFASILGMEAGVFMPTGTLANHIAIRKHAGIKRRVLVQDVSHVYNDTGDAAQMLSGINVIPLAPGRTTFTLEDVLELVDRTKKGRVKTDIGVISIESPVRRKNNEMFDFSEMKKISEFARSNGIKMHLDGARLFNAVAHSGIPVKDFAALFDTVYISLYKDFNAASGAVLCCTSEFAENLYHTRRMFGGGMPQAWPFAAVANHYADSFLSDYSKALKNFDAFTRKLNNSKGFKISTIKNGSNVFKMEVETNDIRAFSSKLSELNISLPAAVGKTFYPKTNTTLLRTDPNKLADIFIESIL